MNVKNRISALKTTDVRTNLVHIPVSVTVATNGMNQVKNAKVNEGCQQNPIIKSGKELNHH